MKYPEDFINKVILGDCLEVMKDITDASIDMILCDLPYGTTACKWDTIIPMDLLWLQYLRIIKNNGAIVLFSSQPFTTNLINSNIKLFKYELIWEKSKASNFVHAKFKPLKSHENILIFSKGGSAHGSKMPMNYFPQKKDGKSYFKGIGIADFNWLSGGNTKRNTLRLENKSGKRYPRSVIYFRTAESEGKLHPTQKPIALCEYLIKTYTNENMVVLDNCAGSGTTGIAARNTSRNFILIEKEEKYYNIINKRIKNGS